jgi:hypothetical protein
MRKRTPRMQAAKGFSLMDELAASPTNPMPKVMRDHQLSVIHTSLENIAKGAAPTLDELSHLSDVVNILDTLHGMTFADRITKEGGYALEIDRKVIDGATEAIKDAFERHKAGGQIRLSGTGLAAIRTALATYTQFLDELPARVVINAWRRTRAEILAALAGRGDPKTVVLKHNG